MIATLIIFGILIAVIIYIQIGLLYAHWFDYSLEHRNSLITKIILPPIQEDAKLTNEDDLAFGTWQFVALWPLLVVFTLFAWFAWLGWQLCKGFWHGLKWLIKMIFGGFLKRINALPKK